MGARERERARARARWEGGAREREMLGQRLEVATLTFGSHGPRGWDGYWCDRNSVPQHRQPHRGMLASLYRIIISFDGGASTMSALCQHGTTRKCTSRLCTPRDRVTRWIGLHAHVLVGTCLGPKQYSQTNVETYSYE